MLVERVLKTFLIHTIVLLNRKKCVCVCVCVCVFRGKCRYVIIIANNVKIKIVTETINIFCRNWAQASMFHIII